MSVDAWCMTSHKIYLIQQKWVITINKDEGEKSLMGIFVFLFLTNEVRCLQFLLVSHALNYYIEEFYKGGCKMLAKSFNSKIS